MSTTTVTDWAAKVHAAHIRLGVTLAGNCDACRKDDRPECLSVTAASVAGPTPVSTAAPSVSRGATSPGGGLAAITAGIPTPADTFGLARAYCEVRGGGFGVVFGLDGGRKDEPAGPTFPKPKTAVELAALLNGRLSV